jgi:hypothetical protein
MMSLLASALMYATGQGQTHPPAAREILRAATVRAGQEGKQVFVMFSATWCQPCRVTDEFLRRKEVAEVLHRYYIVAKISGFARKDTDLQNAGAEQEKDRLARGSGLPAFAILDSKGVLLSDLVVKEAGVRVRFSVPPGKTRVGPFLKHLHELNPKISDDDLWKLRRLMES